MGVQAMKEVDLALSTRLLVEAGVIKVVEKASDGDILAELNDEELHVYQSLVEEEAELKDLEKSIKELQIKLNTKIIVTNARRDMWWDGLTQKHSLSAEDITCGAHVDRAGKVLRKGIIAKTTVVAVRR